MGKKKISSVSKSKTQTTIATTSNSSSLQSIDEGESTSITHEEQMANALQSNRKKPNSKVLLDLHYLEPVMKSRVKEGMVIQQARKTKNEIRKMRELNVKHKKNKNETKKRATKASTTVQSRNTDYVLEEESRTRLCLRLHPSETDPELAVRLTDDKQVVRYKTTPETGINIRQLARSIGWFISGDIDEEADIEKVKPDSKSKKEDTPSVSSNTNKSSNKKKKKK